MTDLDHWRQLRNYYRFMRGEEALEQAAEGPNADDTGVPRPDASWLAAPPVVEPDAVTLWTALGLKRYVESGLLAWHISRVGGQIDSWVVFSAIKVYGQNEHQVFCPPDQIRVIRRLPVPDLLRSLGLSGMA
ncbi:MAG TPA: hypothetical protein VL588_01275 [Bdellovibrionota bacterium]|jgi:hypothetical protein|nr:hypothetical protein [Bdellovibrionota bacterium]